MIPQCAIAVFDKVAWRCGVVDSIRGYEPLDLGSTPGTSACFVSKGHSVTDSIGGCGPPDPGSIPGGRKRLITSSNSQTPVAQ